MKQIFMSKSDKDTQKIGEELVKSLKAKDVILLYGDLGYGKTTFVKGVAKGLGINSRIISPTFVIVREHKTKGKNIKVLYHIDLYRIENNTDIKEVGVNEILEGNDSVTFIEWPEKLQSKPLKHWEVKFEMNKDNTRAIKIQKHE